MNGTRNLFDRFSTFAHRLAEAIEYDPVVELHQRVRKLEAQAQEEPVIAAANTTPTSEVRSVSAH